MNKMARWLVKLIQIEEERTMWARTERQHLPLTFHLDSIMSKRLRHQRAMWKVSLDFWCGYFISGDKVKVIEFEAAFENAPIKVEFPKTDITGEKELPGAKAFSYWCWWKACWELDIRKQEKTHMIETSCRKVPHSERNLHHMDIRWQVM